MITRVNMIILMQPDLEAAVTFYEQLGLGTKIFHIPGSWAEFEVAGVKIGLCPTSREAEDRRSGIVFELEALNDFYQAKHGQLAFLAEPITKPHGILVSVKDPGGNIIDLYQPTPDVLRQLVEKTAQTGCCKGAAAQCGCKKARCQV